MNRLRPSLFLLKLKNVVRYKRKFLNILFLIPLIFGVATFTSTYFIGTSVLSIGIVFLGSFGVISSRLTVISVLAALCIGFVLVHATSGQELRNTLILLGNGVLTTDMTTYLHVVNKIKAGEGFYPAFAESVKGQLGAMPSELWTWKQPLIFFLWKYFPGGSMSIVNLALVMFSLVFVASYLIGRKFLSPIAALLCPYMIWPYLTYPFVEQTILQVEWWGLCFLFYGLAAYFYERRLLAGIFFGLCLGVRELFIIPIFFIILADLLNRRFYATVKISIVIVAIFLPLYLFHLLSISQFQNVSDILFDSVRSGSTSGWITVRPTLSYNSWSYALINFRPFLILMFLNTILLIINMVRVKKVNDLTLLSIFLPFFLISFKLGSDLWHDYWGIYYVPLMLMVTPISINNLRNSIK